MQKPIAILGGTFNPIHNGHIALARFALEECNLSKVVFLPNGNPPHKSEENIIDSVHRYNMVKLAIDGESNFDVSDYEIKRDMPSYTVDTQRELKKIYECPLYFIIGADSLYTLHRWKSPETLIRECSFIVADRDSEYGSDVKSYADEINKSGGNVIVLSMPKIDVTSTMIRTARKSGKNISGFVPEKVYEYIDLHRLYL